MDCPNCGCPEALCDDLDDDLEVAQCPCCEMTWVADGSGLDRILVGPEG